MIKVNSHELSRVLGKALPAVPTKSVIPVLECVLLSMKGGVLTVTATDLNLTIKASIPADGDGSVLVPARTLGELLKALPDSPIAIHTEGHSTAVITTDTGEFRMNAENPADFPAVAKGEAGESMAMNGAILSHSIRAVSFAASSDEMKGALQAVFIDTNGNVVATDAHRLMLTRLGVSPARGLLIPRRSADAVAKIFEAPVDITVEAGDSHATFTGPEATVITRLMDGKYPDYMSVIPSSEGRTEVAFEIPELRAAMKRAGLFANETSKRVALTVGPDGMTIVADNPDTGRSCTERLVCAVTGNPVTVGFNSGYLAEVLANIPGLHARMYVDSPSRAVTVSGDDRPEDIALIMPVLLT